MILEFSEDKLGRLELGGTDEDNNDNSDGTKDVDDDRDQRGNLQGTTTGSVNETTEDHHDGHNVEVLCAGDLILGIPDLDHGVQESSSRKDRSRASSDYLGEMTEDCEQCVSISVLTKMEQLDAGRHKMASLR